VTLSLALGLAACSDDDEPGPPAEEPAGSSAAVNPEATLPDAVAQSVTPAHLNPICPSGQFTEADAVLSTLPEEYAAEATKILTYDCDELIDQVVWAELPDADRAAELLDPEASGGVPAFVADTTVLLVNERLVDEAGLDVTAYFEALSEACGCGTF
jgi:hypothetical protein